MEGLVMIGSSLISPKFWYGKRVLITGHSGFKGSWLTHWLHRLGSEVFGIALPPTTVPNLFKLADIEKKCQNYFCDINDASKLAGIVKSIQPEIVFHLAAQPLVRAGYRDPLTTFNTNIMGTAHVLESLRDLQNVRAVVMVTTDKVYRENKWGWMHREDDILGGRDPYSASKAASEIVVTAYREAYLRAQEVSVATARAGNVIGGGDWSEDRLIPDAIRAWRNNQPLVIRNPMAIRPWQHVLESLNGYLILGEKIYEKPSLADSYNFGPDQNQTATVSDVINMAITAYGGGTVQYDEIHKGPVETDLLSLENSKARSTLGVYPKWGLLETVNRTMKWYLEQQSGVNARRLLDNDIDVYEKIL